MDFESFGDLDREQINQIGITFMRQVETLTGKKMIIYSDTSNASDVFYGELTNYPLWVAQYEVEEPTPNGNWSSWAGWQYTDVGEIPGISGNVDRDKFTRRSITGRHITNTNYKQFSKHKWRTDRKSRKTNRR